MATTFFEVKTSREESDLFEFVRSHETAYWYAVLRDQSDNDWGSGSYDKEEALQQARELRDSGETDVRIAIINNGAVIGDDGKVDERAVKITDPLCVDIITEF